MPRLVISTVGTSLLTNQMKERTDPKDWKRRLNETANFTDEEVRKGTKDKEGVDHFYIGIHFRISCKAVNGKIKLRYYGNHDYVEGKELK